VTERLLLDTHIALWHDSGDDRLSPATRELIDECWRSGGTICFSAVSACPLVSYDRRIAEFAKRRGRRYGFAVASSADIFLTNSQNHAIYATISNSEQRADGNPSAASLHKYRR
jgi:hypothetical protein